MKQTTNPRSETHTIHSRIYGTFEVTQHQLYHFPRGLVGLHENRDYALIQVEDGPFSLLHALNDDLSFILLPAHLAKDDYGFQIDEATAELLRIAKPDEVNTFVIVNAMGSVLYVNLKAPILVAPGSLLGCQFIIDDPSFPIRYSLVSKEGA